MLCEKYQHISEDGDLKVDDKMLPLQIMNVDKTGKTAISLAIEAQCNTSAELMIQLLGEFKEIPLSKMFLKELATIIDLDSDLV